MKKLKETVSNLQYENAKKYWTALIEGDIEDLSEGVFGHMHDVLFF